MFLPDMDPEDVPDLPPRYNIAPTQPIASVLQPKTDVIHQLELVRWGLIPFWADDPAIGNRMINARGETVDSKPSFRKPFASQRCLIPADGFYEWKKTSDGKQPYLIETKDGSVFAMAGLWDENTKITEDGTPIRSCTIITTQANQTMQSIHDRMPVILQPSDYDRWLDPGFRDKAALKALLRPAADDLLRMRPVSRRVNNPKHDDETCVQPV